MAKDIRETSQPFDPQTEYDALGTTIDVSEPHLVVQYHPIPTAYEGTERRVGELLAAIRRLDMPTFWFWPNIDAGKDAVTAALQRQLDDTGGPPVAVFRNLPPKDYLRVLYNSSCFVANSSAGIRECSHLGTPTVNIGDRQTGRERAENVVDVPPDAEKIEEGVRHQLEHGRYEASTLYGDGDATERVLDLVTSLELTRKGSLEPEDLGIESDSESYGPESRPL